MGIPVEMDESAVIDGCNVWQRLVYVILPQAKPALLAAMIMASLSGSAVADTAAVAALLVPMMRSANYPVNRAAGLIASGGIIAPIIPPVPFLFIIFGVSSGLSISKLFMAGVAPRHYDGRNADAHMVVAGQSS